VLSVGERERRASRDALRACIWGKKEKKGGRGKKRATRGSQRTKPGEGPEGGKSIYHTGERGKKQ